MPTRKLYHFGLIDHGIPQQSLCNGLDIWAMILQGAKDMIVLFGKKLPNVTTDAIVLHRINLTTL